MFDGGTVQQPARNPSACTMLLKHFGKGGSYGVELNCQELKGDFMEAAGQERDRQYWNEI